MESKGIWAQRFKEWEESPSTCFLTMTERKTKVEDILLLQQPVQIKQKDSVHAPHETGIRTK